MDERFNQFNARMNVTWAGTNGDLPDPVPYDMSDSDLKRVAEEAIRGGYIPGINADQQASLDDFVVDRFVATPEVLFSRVFVRPKTPFGGTNTHEFIDITGSDNVEVAIRDDGSVLWVNVDGVCVLRVCKIKSITIRDNRIV